MSKQSGVNSSFPIYIIDIIVFSGVLHIVESNFNFIELLPTGNISRKLEIVSQSSIVSVWGTPILNIYFINILQ